MKIPRTLFIAWGISLLLSVASSVCAQSNSTPSFRFATRAEAQMLITDIDDYTRNWNQFDINSRLQTTEGKKSQLLTLAMNETRSWSDKEKERINRAMKAINTQIKKQKLTLPFPNEVVLVKTTMKEEGGAGGYTRKNWIALGENILNEASDETLTRILSHEIFHILTRNNKKFKAAAYSTIGFHVLNREILFPADIIEKRISNPDISSHDSYGVFTIQGEKKNCTMLLYTPKAYNGAGSFFEYAKVGLIPLNEQFIPIQHNGETLIYNLSDAEDFLSQVGENTNYIINPEEILADHFSFILTGKKEIKSPDVIERLKQVLKTSY